ncbi:unnamed protein product [Closterium sp. NIES-54]
MMEKFFSFMSFYEQYQQASLAQANNIDNNNRATLMSLDGSSYARGNQQQLTFAPYEPQRGSISFAPHTQSSPGQEKTLDALQSEGLGFESQCVHFGHPSAGGCQRSTGDPRLILGKGYRLVVLGGYGRTDPLLNKPFYPNGTRLLLAQATTKASTLRGSTTASSNAAATSTTAAATSTAAAAASTTPTAATEAPTPATTPTSTATPSASSTASTAAPTVPSTTLAPLALAVAAPPTRSRRSPDLRSANEVDNTSRSNRGEKGDRGIPLKERGARVAARSTYS